MFKRNTFSSCAGIVATLVLGTAFSTTLFAAGGAQIRRARQVTKAEVPAVTATDQIEQLVG